MIHSNILETIGKTPVVKLNVFLIDLSHFSLVNEIMRELFSSPYPARAVVEVSALPKEVSIEVDAVACF